MESKIASANDVLLKALSMDLPDSAEYVLSKEQVTYYPQGSQTYSPEAGRLVRFTLGDNSGAMLDPTSVRLSYILRNKKEVANVAARTTATTLQLLGPQSIWGRLRVLINGSLAEDVLSYGQTVNLFDRLTPSSRRYTNLLENNWIEPIFADPTSKERRMVHPLMSGILSQDRMLYLKVAPVTLELELVGDPDEAFAGAGNKFEVSDFRLLANIVYLTPEFLDQITRSLLRGVPLPIAYETFAVQKVSYTPASGSFTLQINRSLTRISKLFWTFYKSPANPADADVPVLVDGDLAQPSVPLSILSRPQWRATAMVDGNLAVKWNEADQWKEVNCFYHPANGQVSAATDTLEWSVLFGSKQLPVIPVRGIAESAWYLRAALGQSYYGSHDIILHDYCSRSFIACISFDRTMNCAGEGNSQFGGLSSVQGAQITLNVRNSPDPGNMPAQVTIYLMHDAIASIRAEATEILL
jgi:hypothetical protein